MADQAKRRAEIARFTQHLLQFFSCSLWIRAFPTALHC
jgi:hypothetical protein